VNSFSHRLYYFIEGAWRRRYVIAVPMLILPLFGLLVGLLSPKQYTSHTSMLIQETAKMNPFLEDLAVSAMLKERIAALETLLHSRYILTGVARMRGLIDDQTSAKRQDEIIQQLSNALSMKMSGKDLIRIDYRSESPDGMKETLETVSNHFIEQLMAPERSSMRDSEKFLAEHLTLRRQDLERAESALAKFKNQHADQLPELHSGNITRLASLKQRLSERQAELAGARKSLGGLDQQLSKTNPVVGRIEEQMVQIRSELALMRARYTDRHSKIQGHLRSLRRLEQERVKTIQQNGNGIDVDQLWSIAGGAATSDENGVQPLLVSQLENLQLARSRVDALSEESASLQLRINELESLTSSMGAQEQQLSKLQRDLKVKRKLYEDLLERHEMARLTGSLGVFEREKRIKLIDRPYTPSGPSNPPLILFALAGLFGGIFLGSGLALVLEITDTTIRWRDQLEALIGVPVFTRIPPLGTAQHAPSR
jgi:polysaccharide chain length determinant protein (PEP-CTERM system associated)